MTYDTYGRPLQETAYFEAQNTSVPDYSRQYTAEPRNTNSSAQKRTSSTAQQTSKMSVPERTESTSHDVSPELIAAITERVKKECMSLTPRTSALYLTYTNCSNGTFEADWHAS